MRTNSSVSRPSSSNRKMLIRSMTTAAPLGGIGPAGDWVNSRAKVPSIHVWQATVLPSATMMPLVIFRSSKAARSDAEVCGEPGVVGFEAIGTVETEVFLVEVGVGLGLVVT